MIKRERETERERLYRCELETLDRLKTHLADNTARLEKVREGYIDTEKQRQKRQTETKETEKQRQKKQRNRDKRDRETEIK